MKKTVIAIVSSLLLMSCVSLKEVRDYANESAKFAAYTELTTYFRDTYDREKPYLTAEDDRLARENDKKRRESYKNLLGVHERLALYMKTLAVLAGDDTFDISKEIDSLGKQINKMPELGFEEKHVTACTDIAKIIAKWATTGMQQKAVREMVTAGDAPLQDLLEGMGSILRIYRKTHNNERDKFNGLFEVELAYTNDKKDKLLQTLARVHRNAREVEFRAMDEKFDAAERGVKKIAEGHKELVRNVNTLSTKEAKDMIGKIAKDIKRLRSDLEAVAP